MPKMTEQIVFDQVLQPRQAVVLEEVAHLTGIITSVCFHFPPGVVGLMEVAVGHGSRQIMPRAGFLALDDATPVFPCYEVIKRDETVWCVVQNTDNLWQHRISATVVIDGE